tara:strand:- start:3422 stop:3595 length:174 start_codon:yes stop_codon:yes gene_type:complete
MRFLINMKYNIIKYGFIITTVEDGKDTNTDFVANDVIEYEDMQGNPIENPLDSQTKA